MNFSLSQIREVAGDICRTHLLNASQPKPCVIYLHGGLGTGKSTLVATILRVLGLPEKIPVLSPTYPYIQSYQMKDLHVAHMDLYRLDHVSEATFLSIIDDPKNFDLIFVEWPERFTTPLILPPQLLITLSSTEIADQRSITVTK